MSSRRVIGHLSLALALWGCDPSTPSVPEGEPDAANDALPPAPGCPYAPQPFGICEPSLAPAPACTVEIEGYELAVRRTFDERGRAVGHSTWFLGGTLTSTYLEDGEGRERLNEYLEDGCLSYSAVSEPLGEGWLTRTRDAMPGFEVCTFRVRHDDQLLLEQQDPGCDCRDVRTVMDCEDGPHGPLRCEEFDPDGSPGAVHRLVYDDAGRRIGWHTDHDGDGVYELERTWTFDAEGRLIGEWLACARCEPPWLVRRSILYEVDPRRSTSRSDVGDDGWAESIKRMTFDADDRLVLEEHGDDDGMIRRVETVYDDRGGYVQATTERGRVVASRSLVIEGHITTETYQSEGEDSTDITRVDADGRLVERFRLEAGREQRRVHDLYARDERGRVTSQRTRRWDEDGVEETFTLRFTWHGACPVAPDGYDGELFF